MSLFAPGFGNCYSSVLCVQTGFIGDYVCEVGVVKMSV